MKLFINSCDKFLGIRMGIILCLLTIISVEVFANEEFMSVCLSPRTHFNKEEKVRFLAITPPDTPRPADRDSLAQMWLSEETEKFYQGRFTLSHDSVPYRNHFINAFLIKVLTHPNFENQWGGVVDHELLLEALEKNEVNVSLLDNEKFCRDHGVLMNSFATLLHDYVTMDNLSFLEDEYPEIVRVFRRAYEATKVDYFQVFCRGKAFIEDLFNEENTQLVTDFRIAQIVFTVGHIREMNRIQGPASGIFSYSGGVIIDCYASGMVDVDDLWTYQFARDFYYQYYKNSIDLSKKHNLKEFTITLNHQFTEEERDRIAQRVIKEVESASNPENALFIKDVVKMNGSKHILIIAGSQRKGENSGEEEGYLKGFLGSLSQILPDQVNLSTSNTRSLRATAFAHSEYLFQSMKKWFTDTLESNFTHFKAPKIPVSSATHDGFILQPRLGDQQLSLEEVVRYFKSHLYETIDTDAGYSNLTGLFSFPQEITLYSLELGKEKLLLASVDSNAIPIQNAKDLDLITLRPILEDLNVLARSREKKSQAA